MIFDKIIKDENKVESAVKESLNKNSNNWHLFCLKISWL